MIDWTLFFIRTLRWNTRLLGFRDLLHCVRPRVLLELDFPDLAEASRPDLLQKAKWLSTHLSIGWRWCLSWTNLSTIPRRVKSTHTARKVVQPMAKTWSQLLLLLGLSAPTRLLGLRYLAARTVPAVRFWSTLLFLRVFFLLVFRGQIFLQQCLEYGWRAVHLAILLPTTQIPTLVKVYCRHIRFGKDAQL